MTDALRTRTSRGVPSWVVLVGFLAVTAAVAGLGSLATTAGVDGWYEAADKPPFNPPSAVFGPVWSLLYALIAIAGWLLWSAHARGEGPARKALTLWWVQLGVNLAWTPVFFALEWLWAGLAVIVALDHLVVLTIVAARPVSKIAALLLAPYLAWILFATALNASIAWLN